MQAQVVRAPLHAGRGERHAERIAQRRNVLEENLFLKVLRAGGDQDPLPAEDRGNQIRERLAGAGAGFGEQDARRFRGPGRRRLPSRPGRRAARKPAMRARAGRRRQRCRRCGRSGRRPSWPARPSGLPVRIQRELPAQPLDFGADHSRAPSSSGVFRARAISSPIVSMSASRMPRVVTAGVPTRMPLATIGGF